MRAIICDKCKKVITDAIRYVSKLEMSTERDGKYAELHLCSDCVDEFDIWLKPE